MTSAARSGVAAANGLEIVYEEFGNADDPPILLIMGLASQLTQWPAEFCELLAAQGFRVIRFDNRDIGLSTKMSGARVDGNMWLRMGRSAIGKPSAVPYTLPDLADDTRGLLDELGIESAHVVGASMGGMIAQIFAAKYPERVRTLGIIFSTTNQAFLPPPAFAALQSLITGPKDSSRAAAIDVAVRARKTLASPKYRQSDEALRANAERDYDRSYYPAGIVRQFAAVTGTGSLLEYTKRIDRPTVVVHGSADPLIRPAGGKAVAKAIPGAKLHIIDGMGHDLPPQLHERLAAVLTENFARAHG